MAITTINGKLAIMEMDDDWEPGLPLSPGTLGTGDQQQLLWGFPEILWAAAVFIFDLNTRLSKYLATYYAPSPEELTSETVRYFGELSGDTNNRLKRLINDASA